MPRISYQDIPEELFNVMRAIGDYLSKTSLDHQLLELVKYRVSQINACAYCLDMHYKEAIHAGETELRLHLLAAWRETDLFNDKEKAVLAFTDALTLVAQQHIEDTIYDTLSAYFSSSEIANLSLAIVEINSWNRLMKAFKFEAGHYQVHS